MKALLLAVTTLILPATSALAAEITAPRVPPSGAELMPEDAGNFWEGLMEIMGEALRSLRPDWTEACGICFGVIGIILLLSIVHCFPGSGCTALNLVGTIAVAVVLLKCTNSLVSLAVDTIHELSNYGKLLIPVMTTAMAAQGGITASAALYAGSAAFNSLLSSIISGVLVPLIYIYLTLSVAGSALRETTLNKMRDFVKWLVTWSLKTVLYVFTGYMSISGIISGTVDAAKIKATKLTISGMVPVVGGILSDASEAVLVSAGVVKNSAGIYGILAVLSVCLVPFLRIGTHYLLLKATAAVCGMFGKEHTTSIVQDFATAMGLLAAMTGAVCVLLLISSVCFLREVG